MENQDLVAAVIARRRRRPAPTDRQMLMVQWIKEAERAVGFAPHVFTYLPISHTLGGAALQSANEERLQDLLVVQFRVIDAVFDGYALACALTGKGGDNSGTAFTRGADAARFSTRQGKHGKALRAGPLGDVVSQLLNCFVPPDLREDANVAILNGLAAGLLLHEAEHATGHPAIAALSIKPAAKTPRAPDATHLEPNAAMVDAILAAPDDDSPRLVYADWLTERGDPRGEFIQVQCTLGRSLFGAGGRRGTPTGKRPEEVEALKERERALVKANGLRWLPQPRCFRDWSWRRGFVSSLTASTEPLLGGFATLRREPIELLKLTSFRDSKAFKAPVLFDLAPHPTLRRVDFSSNKVNAKKMAVIGRPFFSQLNGLDLSHNDLSDPASMTPFVKGDFPKLRELRLIGTRLTLESLERLADAPFFSRLTHLRLYFNAELGPGLVKVLERATSLQYLDVGSTGIDEKRTRALLDRNLLGLTAFGTPLAQTIVNRYGDTWPESESWW